MIRYFFLLFSVLFTSLAAKSPFYNDFDKNPYIPAETKKKMKPYLLPIEHSAKSTLDSIFCTKRVTQDDNSFTEAGFTNIKRTSRSFLLIAKHPLLPEYLVKAALDSELNKKQNKPAWHWMLRRCQGAENIAKVIEKKKFTLFTVPKKWIYPLPIKPSPPNSAQYDRKIVVLLVTDMHLVPKEENLQAWKTKITEKHLDELYEIMSQAGGSSYRADNICYTKDGTFAFIDTEYPNQEPDFSEIRKYLSTEMQAYWDNKMKSAKRTKYYR